MCAEEKKRNKSKKKLLIKVYLTLKLITQVEDVIQKCWVLLLPESAFLFFSFKGKLH